MFVFFFHQLRLIVVEFCFVFCFDLGHCNHFQVAQMSMISVLSNKVVSLLFHSFSLGAKSTVVTPSRQDVIGGGAPSRRGSSESSDGGCSFSLGAKLSTAVAPSRWGCSGVLRVTRDHPEAHHW